MKNIISLILTFLVVNLNYSQCPAVNSPYGENFGSGTLPTCWSQSVITGDGWQFTGTPGYDAANNGRTAGTYAWIDFSSDDQGVIMELVDVDVSSLSAPQIEFDYFCYNSTNPTPANILNVEAFDGTNWVLISSIQINTLQGWNPYYFSLVGYDVSGIVSLRLRAESGGATNDFYNDILVDNLFIRQAPTCPSPLVSSFGVSNLTADSAEISWLAGGNELLWSVEWGVSGFNFGSGSYNTTTNFFSYPVTGLSPITSYDFYVKAICSSISNSSVTVTACNSYNWRGYTYSQSGTYYDITSTVSGCYSVFTLNLTIDSIINVTENITACSSYQWNGNNYTQSGTYYDSSSTISGCDSIFTLNLTIDSIINVTENITACSSYQWKGNNYTQSGTYYDSSSTISGCDSIFTLNLTIDSIINVTENITACSSYQWKGNNYTQSGTYYDSSSTISGCDSIFTLNLTINVGDSSYWAGPFTFVTPCATLTPPQLEDFTNSFPPNTCWDQAGDGDQFSGPTNIGTSSWITDGFANVGTTGAVRCYLANTLNKEWVLSPQYDFSNGGPFQIEFDFGIFTAFSSTPGTLGSDDYISVLISDDGGTSWEEIVKYDNNYVTNTNGNYEIIALTNSFLSTLNIDTNNFNINGTIQFAFWATDGRTNDLQSNDVMFDNFRVIPVPSCPQPQAISSFGITSDSASLTWASFASDSIWMVYLTPAGITPDSSHLTIVNNDTVFLSGLNSSSFYDVYVGSICSINDSSYLTGPYRFSTLCSTAIAPYSQDFNYGTLPLCWTQSVVSGDGWQFTGTPGYDAANNGQSPGTYAWIDFSGTDQGTVMELVEVDISSLTAPQIEFDYFCYNTTNPTPANILNVEAFDGTNWVLISSIQTNTFPNWNPYNFSLIGFDSLGLIKVRLRGESGGATDDFYNDILVDNLFIRQAPTCPRPLVSSFGIGNLNSNSTEISWVAGGNELLWSIEWDTSGFTLGTGNYDTTSNFLNYPISGLSSTSSYDFYVRAICSPGDSSYWTGPFSFTTPCSALSLPQFEDFSLGFPPSICWDEAGNGDPLTGPSGFGTSSWVTDGFANVGINGAVKCNLSFTGKNEWILTPQYDFNIGGPYQIEFDLGIFTASSSNPGTLGSDDEVQILISRDGGATWISLAVYNSNYITGVNGNHEIITLRNDTNGIIQFALWATEGAFDDPQNNDVMLDNFKIIQIPNNDLGVVLADLPSASTGCEGDSSFVTVTIVNFGYQPQSGFTIQYTLNGVPVIETISNTLQPGDSLIHTFSVPVDLTQDGSYSFDFTTNLPNDDNTTNDAFGSTLTFENYFTPDPPNVSNDTVCVNSLTPKGTSAKLIASGNATASFEWFDSTGNYLASGDTLFTDTINTITSYFVSSKELAPGNIGAPTNNFGAGSGGFDNLFPNGLVFNVYSDLTLDSVTIYPDGPGTIQIKIVNIIGATIYSNFYTIGQNINPGSKLKVPIGQNITAGNGYIIEVSFVSLGNLSLYRNTLNASYPYNYSNIASIISSTNGSIDSYFYFYNWDISTISCSSEKSEAVVYIDQCVGIEKINYSNFNIYPNPNNGCFEINFNNPSINTKIEIFDLTGKKIYKNTITNEDFKINLNKFKNGFYLVNTIQNGKIFTKKLQILK